MMLMKKRVKALGIILDQGALEAPLPITQNGPCMSIFILNRSSCGVISIISIMVCQSVEDKENSRAMDHHSFEERALASHKYLQ
jgi:hypothetical protein